jgi:hypothetical protein
MENNKQTAVEWFFDTLVEKGYFKKLPIAEYHEAKEIEKEQHGNTWIYGRIECRCYVYLGKEKTYEEYYKETYGTE